jgi:hypothetical protein
MLVTMITLGAEPVYTNAPEEARLGVPEEMTKGSGR